MSDAQGPPQGGPQGPPPPPLFLERMGRLQTAIHCGTPDRVPLSLVMDTFACNVMGVTYAEFCADLDVSGQTMLGAVEKLGDVDSMQWASYSPAILGTLWLAPMKLPGRELPDDALWQLDEQVRIQPEDYDRIVEMGWDAWLGPYMGRYLGDTLAALGQTQEKAPRWVGEFIGHGYVPFSAGTVDHPYEHLCGGRTIQEFTMDLFTRPDKVEAAMQKIMESKRVEAREMIRAIGPFGYWVGSWRTAPQFLSPKLWDRFVWPYMKELVELVAEEGGIPMLHFDACWNREIERLLELPTRTCVLATDGATDLFRAKKILGGHMCLMGDVPPAMLTLGTTDEVKAYCDRLLTEVGPDGFIMAMGCAVPPNAKFENVKAMVESVQGR
jgi:hypothetical protein